MTTISLSKATGTRTATTKVQIKSTTPIAALSFSIRFDPSELKFQSITLDKGRQDFTLSTNEKGAADGVVGVLLDSGQELKAGRLTTLASIKWSLLKKGAARVEFTDKPAPRSVSDINGRLLATEYPSGAVVGK